MSKLKKEDSKVIAYPCHPDSRIVNESGSKIRPNYHPGYQGYKCRIHLVKENTINEPIQVSDQKEAYNLVKEAEVFKGALLANAVSIILCHNHPSGNLEPSADDLRITELMKEAGKLIGIKVLDHLIVSHMGYSSINN